MPFDNELSVLMNVCICLLFWYKDFLELPCPFTFLVSGQSDTVTNQDNLRGAGLLELTILCFQRKIQKGI